MVANMGSANFVPRTFSLAWEKALGMRLVEWGSDEWQKFVTQYLAVNLAVTWDGILPLKSKDAYDDRKCF